MNAIFPLVLAGALAGCAAQPTQPLPSRPAQTYERQTAYATSTPETARSCLDTVEQYRIFTEMLLFEAARCENGVAAGCAALGTVAAVRKEVKSTDRYLACLRAGHTGYGGPQEMVEISQRSDELTQWLQRRLTQETRG